MPVSQFGINNPKKEEVPIMKKKKPIETREVMVIDNKQEEAINTVGKGVADNVVTPKQKKKNKMKILREINTAIMSGGRIKIIV